MRLINADEIVTMCENVIQHGIADEDGDHVITAESMLFAVNHLPTIDAVPVMHGHWKEDPSGYGFWICSACGFVSEASAANMLYKFCPVCGAVMDGKDGEHHED